MPRNHPLFCKLLALVMLFATAHLGSQAAAQLPSIPSNKSFVADRIEGGVTYKIYASFEKRAAPGPNPVPRITPTITIYRQVDPTTFEEVHRKPSGETLAYQVLLVDASKEAVAIFVSGDFELSRMDGVSHPTVKIQGVFYIPETDKLRFHGTGFRSLIGRFASLPSGGLPIGGTGPGPLPTIASAAATVFDPCTEDPDDMGFAVVP